jgi:hypothetical protein
MTPLAMGIQAGGVMTQSEVIDELNEESQLPSIQRYGISSYGADYPIDTLYARLTSSEEAGESDIYVPDFQRGYVWTKAQADRFIESLLLGLPVPGIFLYRDEETGRLLIVDGSQRLRTIKLFIEGTFDESAFILGEKVHRTLRTSHTLRFCQLIAVISTIQLFMPQ